MKIFYFTGTGNSLYIAKKIKESFRKTEIISIPQVIDDEKKEYDDEVVGIVFPTYSCNIPKIVKEFLKNVSFKAKYKFAIATYGNNINGDGDVVGSFNNLTKSLEMPFDYINSILMVDNYLDIFEVEKELSKVPSKEIDKNLKKIILDIENGKKYIKKTSIIRKGFTVILKPSAKIIDNGLASKDFVINNKCESCGTCAKVCPTKNILVEDGKPLFGKKCIKCYACIHACPKNAMHLKSEKSSKRYRNPNVSLKEIIDANNQYKRKK